MSGKNMRNRVDIRDGRDGSLLAHAENEESIRKYGVRRVLIVDPEITTVEAAQDQADKLLAAHPWPSSGVESGV